MKFRKDKKAIKSYDWFRKQIELITIDHFTNDGYISRIIKPRKKK